MANPIVVENQNTGSSGWTFSNPASTEIQAYADATSYNPGDTVTFYVSTQTAGHAYTIDIYRIGWYNGMGARLITTLSGLSGVAQGYYDGTVLQNCPSALIDATTHLIDANWTASTTWVIPANACTGVYVACLTDTVNGKQWGICFVVKGNVTADYVMVRPFTTDAAYNTWGGYSLYTSTKATKISLNRPQGWGDAGLTNLFAYDIPALHWFERMGYNMAYRSSIDLHANAAELLNFKAFVSLGHDEYWSKAMYDGVLAARDSGVGLAFMGANACYWQIRFEADAGSRANHTITCYKVLYSTYTPDPMYGVDNTVVTTQWRDQLIRRPESILCGIMYSTNNHVAEVAWTLDANPDMAYLGGTGLSTGTAYGCDVVGNEWDKVSTGSPNNVKVIATTAVIPGVGGTDVSHTTTYVASSGALVFAAGSLFWGNCLDDYRRYPACTPKSVPGMQALLANIMTALISRPKNPTGFSSFMAHV